MAFNSQWDWGLQSIKTLQVKTFNSNWRHVFCGEIDRGYDLNGIIHGLGPRIELLFECVPLDFRVISSSVSNIKDKRGNFQNELSILESSPSTSFNTPAKTRFKDIYP